jgi:2-polyprenyl-6-methoxyphenol hydroxylase-like FAD-dependent oxidoreductase
MPQWDFLNFMADEARQYKNFRLMMEAEGTDLIIENEVVKGIKARCAGQDMEIRAALVIACDGRSSVMRDKGGFKVTEEGVPIDVLWFRIPKVDEGEHSLGYIKDGYMMVAIERQDYYQCGYIVAKNEFDKVRAQGLEAFRNNIVMLAPYLKPRVASLDNWDDVKLLSVQINYLDRWYRQGMVCIGDAAHAMSPVGGVGINLAVQDAVATANILGPAFTSQGVSIETLASIQERREMPARRIQKLQAFIHNNLFNPQKESNPGQKMKIPLWFFDHFPILRRIPARVIGMGFRPEHIR